MVKNFYLFINLKVQKRRTFCIKSNAFPVTKVSLPLSSTVIADSFSKVIPAAKEWPGLLSRSSYLMWIFEIESFKFPITVLIKDPNQDLFLRKAKKKIGYSDDT